VSVLTCLINMVFFGGVHVGHMHVVPLLKWFYLFSCPQCVIWPLYLFGHSWHDISYMPRLMKRLGDTSFCFNLFFYSMGSSKDSF
jgi:hypothetical protein